MGCMVSSQRSSARIVPTNPMNRKPLSESHKGETVLAALTRLDEEIASSERTHPVARLAVVAAELESIQQEVNQFEETTTAITKDTYAKTIHQLFTSLDLYRRPMLASENEDFVANVNRKEMRRLELSWLRARYGELMRERRVLHAQILRIRSLYGQLQQLLESIWGRDSHPGTPLEGALTKASTMRDALAQVSARLRAAAEYAHAAVRILDDALPAWKLTTVGKSGWERTSACADACRLMVRARCAERGARRVLGAPAAPRAARTLRLALDYAFTDALHDHKYQRATEIFFQFKEALVLLIDSIHQAMRQEKIVTPYFCYHERLSIAGNCRMCLVHVEGMWKPQIACGVPVFKDMKIRTNSPITQLAQESVLEFILMNHPLDCPICDQGGECDLQDLTMRFGSDRSRFTDIFFDGKTASENKELSPLIRGVMTRCIHCTRCIRFASQVCGMEILGTTGRGHGMLVGTYVDKMFLSELSGNIIDLCPVGALTSIPFMFKGRSWELMKANSIDVTDATGTNITLNYRYDRVLRVLPREHEEINEEWVSDKGRWAIDSLEMQRLVTPIKRHIDCCQPLEWNYALREACDMIKDVKPDRILAIAGPHTNVETLVACKDFLNMLGCENTYIERGFDCLGSGADIRAGYSLNIKMCDVAQADKILLIGTNPRFEAPILNAWIRQAYRNNEADIYVIGPKCEYNYHVTYLGETISAISRATSVLKDAKKPLIFVGIEHLDYGYSGDLMSRLATVLKSLKKVKDWEILHVLPLEASFAGALEAGWKPGVTNKLEQAESLGLIISLGADQIFYDCELPFGNKIKIIYIGFQGDKGAEIADLILPGSAYTESGGVYLNMECRSQLALPAVTPPGKARHDWKIIRAVAEYCGICLSYSDYNGLCTRLGQISPLFTCLGNFQPRIYDDLVMKLIQNKECDGADKCELNVAMQKIEDYYCSDIFTYNSPAMIRTKKAAKEFTSSPYHQL